MIRIIKITAICLVFTLSVAAQAQEKKRHGLDIIMPDDSCLVVTESTTIRQVEADLKAGGKVNCINKLYDTPLGQAAGDSTDVAIIKVLLKAGANVDYISVKYIGTSTTTPLMRAALANPNLAITETLIKAGANVNAGDRQNATALMFAPENPNLAIVEALLKAGANVNAVDDFGDTALISAVTVHNQRAVEILIKAGANLNIMDSHGVTPLIQAVKTSDPDIAVVEALLEGGAYANMKDDECKTALDYAKHGTPIYDLLKQASQK